MGPHEEANTKVKKKYRDTEKAPPIFHFFEHVGNGESLLLNRKKKNYIEKMAELAVNELFAELRTLVSEVSTYESQVEQFTINIDNETIQSNNLKSENEKLLIEKSENEKENSELNTLISRKESEINVINNDKNETENKIKNFDSILESLINRSLELLKASEVFYIILKLKNNI